MTKILLHTKDYYHVINIHDILYCKSDNSYTTFHLVNREPITVSHPISEYENKFDDTFIRPHQSYLVNVNYVNSLQKTGDCVLHLSDGSHIPVSSRKKKDIIQFISNSFNNLISA